MTGALRYKLYGVAVLAVIAGLVALAIAAYNQAFTSYVPVSVHISRAGLQLLPGSDVKLRGIVVGEVASITSDGTGVTLNLRLSPAKAKEIPANVSVELVPKTLFGEKYVALQLPDRPSSRTLASGGVISEDQARPALEIDQALDDLLPMLRAVQPGELNATLTALATALDGRGAELGQLLQQLPPYLSRFDPHLTALAHDFASLAGVSGTYAQAAPDLLRLVRNFTATGDTVVGERAQLQGFLDSMTVAAGDTRDLLQRSAQDIIQVTVASQPVLQLLATYSPEFPCMIQGVVAVIPRIKVDVAKTGPFQHMAHVVLEFLPPYPGYRYPTDLPQFADTRGPNCYGLPNPPLSLPRVYYKDGTQNDPRFKHLPGGSPSSGTDMGAAGTAGEKSLVDVLLGPELSLPPASVPDIADLLWGPLARGTNVVAT